MKTLIVLFALLLPLQVLAQGEAPPEEDAPEADAPEADAPEADGENLNPGESSVDLLTQRMTSLVERYYTGVALEATPAALDNGLESIRLMLLDGVSLQRIGAAVDEAIRLHTPGRNVPFEVAVPLRVRPGEPTEAPDPRATNDPSETAPPVATQPPLAVREMSPEEEARLLEERRARSAKRARIRLYRQWQERTRTRRGLLAGGVASLSAGYAIGFAHAGILALNAVVPHYSAWVTAIPVIGNITLAVWTSAEYPLAIVLATAEWLGVGLIIAGLLHKVDWPYERDPTAMRIGKRKRDGRAALTVRVVPSGPGGLIVGRF